LPRVLYIVGIYSPAPHIDSLYHRHHHQQRAMLTHCDWDKRKNRCSCHSARQSVNHSRDVRQENLSQSRFHWL